MGFAKGSDEVDKVYKGADEVDAIYKGEDLVWEADSGPVAPILTDYSYTGATEEIIVPAGMTEFDFELWGGGGCGGVYGTTVSGGGGGYARGKIPVTPGDTIRIQVGQGGRAPAAVSTNALGGWPDGGRGAFGDTYGGGGGGSSRIWKNGTLMAVAGGGGGAAGYVGNAGAGGGTSGTAGQGGAGTQLAGGAAGGTNAVAGNGPITDETTKRGGDGGPMGSTAFDGGGGGGGYYGGGGGGGDGRAGGGGSGFLHGSVTDGVMYPGSGANSPATLNYPGAPVGHGSQSLGAGNYNTNHGGSGYVKTTLHDASYAHPPVIAPATAYRYYALDITQVQSGTYASIMELELYEEGGGPNQATAATITASSTAFGWVASNMNNGTLAGNGWHSDAVFTGGGSTGLVRIPIDFGVGVTKAIRSFGIAARSGNESSQPPKDFQLFGSNDNVNWTPLNQHLDVTGWVAGSIRTFAAV